MMVIWEEETHGFGRMQRELRKARGLRRRRRVQPPDHGTHRHRHRRLCEGRAGGARSPPRLLPSSGVLLRCAPAPEPEDGGSRYGPPPRPRLLGFCIR